MEDLVIAFPERALAALKEHMAAGNYPPEVVAQIQQQCLEILKMAS